MLKVSSENPSSELIQKDSSSPVSTVNLVVISQLSGSNGEPIHDRETAKASPEKGRYVSPIAVVLNQF